MFNYITAVLLLLCAATAQAGVFVGFGQSASVSYQSSTTASATGTSLTPNTPTGTVDGDLLVAFVNEDDGQQITATGWTQISYIDSYTSSDVAMYYKVASSEGATLSFSRAGGTNEFTCVIMRFTKTAGSWTVTDSASTYGSSPSPFTLTLSDVLVTTPGILIVGWGSDDSQNITTAPADMTLAAEVQSLTSSRCAAWYQLVDSGDYSKSITVPQYDHAMIMAAIGVTN